MAKDLYHDDIVTVIEPEVEFYPAENYHNDYYTNNKMQPYCAVVISPKVNKIRQKFSSKIKQ